MDDVYLWKIGDNPPKSFSQRQQLGIKSRVTYQRLLGIRASGSRVTFLNMHLSLGLLLGTDCLRVIGSITGVFRYRWTAYSAPLIQKLNNTCFLTAATAKKCGHSSPQKPIFMLHLNLMMVYDGSITPPPTRICA